MRNAIFIVLLFAGLALGQTPKATLKSYLETNDVPTQAQFAELIDSIGTIYDKGTFADKAAADASITAPVPVDATFFAIIGETAAVARVGDTEYTLLMPSNIVDRGTFADVSAANTDLGGAVPDGRTYFATVNDKLYIARATDVSYTPLEADTVDIEFRGEFATVGAADANIGGTVPANKTYVCTVLDIFHIARAGESGFTKASATDAVIERGEFADLAAANTDIGGTVPAGQTYLATIGGQFHLARAGEASYTAVTAEESIEDQGDYVSESAANAAIAGGVPAGKTYLATINGVVYTARAAATTYTKGTEKQPFEDRGEFASVGDANSNIGGAVPATQTYLATVLGRSYIARAGESSYTPATAQAELDALELAAVQKVADVTSLLALTPTDGDVRTTIGYTTARVGANTYTYDASSTDAIDGGIVLPGPGGTISFDANGVFNGNPGTGGRWLAGTATASQFGCTGSGDESGKVKSMFATLSDVHFDLLVEATQIELPDTVKRITADNSCGLKLPNGGQYPMLTTTASSELERIDGLLFDGNRANKGPTNLEDYVARCSGLSKTVVTGCTLKNHVRGLRFELSSGLLVTNNTFLDFTANQVVLKSGCNQNVISANIMDDSGNGTPGLHCIDIEALTALSERNIVTNNTIASHMTSVQLTGVYTESNTVANNVFLCLEESTPSNCIKVDTCGVNNSFRNNDITHTHYGVFDITANSVLYYGNTFREKAGFSSTANLRMSGSGAAYVMHNHMQSGLDGISIASSATDNALIVQNVIDDMRNDGVRSESTSSSGHRIESNIIRRCGRYNIRMDGDDGVIMRNQFLDSTGPNYGCYFAGDNLTVEDNLLQGNTKNFMRFQGSTGCTVRARTLSDVSNLNASTNTLTIVEHPSGAGSPSGSLTPQYIGQEYFDTGGNWYKSTGLTNTDWVQIN